MPRPDALSDPNEFTGRPPSSRALLPLQGLTLLVVEDSRYASDALRLMCQRSGARLRRAETIADARAHLRCYRPDAVIVDLGLPDGRGEDLIRSLASARTAVVLGTSGDPEGRASALAAGAAAFVEKPVGSLSAFQSLICSLVAGPERRAMTPPGEETAAPAPDPLALHDDLAHAAAILADDGSGDRAGYVAGFVQGLARASGDAALEAAAEAARGAAPATAVGHLAHLLAARLDAPMGPLIARRADGI